MPHADRNYRYIAWQRPRQLMQPTEVSVSRKYYLYGFCDLPYSDIWPEFEKRINIVGKEAFVNKNHLVLIRRPT